MAAANGYISRTALKSALGITDTTDDVLLDAIIRDISRAIDVELGRRFYPRIATRTYTARASDRLILDDDLLSITTLQTDTDGDRTYDNTWTTDDYDLEPANALDASPPEPYTEIWIRWNGDYTFPVGVSRGVRIVGTWGYYEVTESLTTLSANATAGATTLTVASGTLVEVGHLLKINSEWLLVSAVSGTTVTVSRAQNGSTAAAHTSGDTVSALVFPVISELALLMASRYFRRKDTPLGVQGAGEFAQLILRNDPDLRRLSMLRRVTVP